MSDGWFTEPKWVLLQKFILNLRPSIGQININELLSYILLRVQGLIFSVRSQLINTAPHRLQNRFQH